MGRKLTLEQMQTIAKERGGRCLSKKYVGNKTKLLWECSRGHQWEATPGSIKNQKSWCNKCSYENRNKTRLLGIDAMHKLAKNRGGKCVSKRYINSHTKLQWECAKRHRWEATPSSVKSGKWCRICSYAVSQSHRRLGIDAMHKLAKTRNGKCLSKKYVNSNTKLKWECSNGHRWRATPGDIKSPSWCPECSSGVGERVCRAYFEQLFENSFPKSYPKWLRNRSGNQMELDGYCADLRIAFEHQGEQHYSVKTQFIKNKKHLQKRKKNDEDKLILCEENGVRLIVIPELFTRTELQDLQRCIYDECKKLHIRCSKGMLKKKIDLKSCWVSNRTLKKLEELRLIAKRRKGRLISKEYVSRGEPLIWECQYGHQWQANAHNVKGKNATWCPDCGGSKKLTLEHMQTIAKSRGGKCHSKEYINNNTKLEWECAKGHRWKARPSSVKSGTWCSQCSGYKKLTIDQMQALAKSKGGRCLSKKYINAHSELMWECSNGHRWEAKPYRVKNSGTWCQKCKKA